MGDSRALLLVEGGAPHADQSDGEGAGTGDCGECGGAGNDLFGRKICRLIHEKDREADADAPERDGSGHCCGSHVLCNRSAIYYRPGAGGGWRAGTVAPGFVSWRRFAYRSLSIHFSTLHIPMTRSIRGASSLFPTLSLTMLLT